MKRRTKQEELLETICWYKCRDLRFEAHKAVATKAVATGSRQQRHAFTTPAVIINFLAIIAGQKKKKKLQRIKAAQSTRHQNRGKKISEAFGKTQIKLGFLCPVAY